MGRNVGLRATYPSRSALAAGLDDGRQRSARHDLDWSDLIFFPRHRSPILGYEIAPTIHVEAANLSRRHSDAS
jgi:hypothetical protein